MNKSPKKRDKTYTPGDRFLYPVPAGGKKRKPEERLIEVVDETPLGVHFKCVNGEQRVRMRCGVERFRQNAKPAPSDEAD